MKIAITGGTGFVGRVVTQLLVEKGHEVYILSRSVNKRSDNVTYIKWLTNDATPENDLTGIDAFINLAGESINNGRWTSAQKKKIYNSRMQATEEVLRIIKTLKQKPKVLINASAIGIYPASNEKIYTEQSPEIGTDFLAKTVHDWEQKAKLAEKLGVRVAYGRFGIILGKDNGALPLMALPYKMFVGGPIGSGQNWMSWIHVKDVANALLFTIEHDIHGPFNVTAPEPKKMKEFGRELAAVLKRPHYFFVPAFVLKMALGEKSQLVLEGQHVMPEVLLKNGFNFEFPQLPNALTDIYL
ncbi:TIGR01777 family oxidoreductase [Psychrobacillus sp. NEAU-3TGS]|uniref:TIGR01777 family oxidoreductase n=1 Tax=Psychrobacillus sp. NEAU-3TGS TaxID=2995412 RepID=UPI002497F78E|nr:TIGR01777 family oxidoreductase [Psychrobacillus sp. NEAU-3TGS]MDI2587123.1 TIGR01777 family oxidoreductase [Psychrobacillus sp. NEAU-3TGS]